MYFKKKNSNRCLFGLAVQNIVRFETTVKLVGAWPTGSEPNHLDPGVYGLPRSIRHDPAIGACTSPHVTDNDLHQHRLSICTAHQ